MNTVNGWLIAWGLAMSAVAIAASLIAWLKHKAERSLSKQLKQARLHIDSLAHAHQTVKDQRDRLNLENEHLHKANGAQAKQNLDLHAKNADLREALQEAQATVELLRMPSDHATVPLVEAAPMAYSEAKPAIDKAAATTKRTRRGKITGGTQ